MSPRASSGAGRHEPARDARRLPPGRATLYFGCVQIMFWTWNVVVSAPVSFM